MKHRRDREWDYISHICKYCSRRFYNGRSRYLFHVRHHEMSIHPYWYVYKSIKKGKPRTFWQPRSQASVGFVLGNEIRIVKTNSKSAVQTTDINGITKKTQISSRALRPFHCKYCTESYSTAQLRNRHQRIHSEETLLHWCQYCNKCFSSASNKKEHEQSHTEQKPYKCKYCIQTFLTAEKKVTHEKIHMRPYHCKFCSQAFSTAAEKMEHQRGHTKETQYNCQYCTKPFSRLSDKTKHEMTHVREMEAMQQYHYDNKRSVVCNISELDTAENMYKTVNKMLSPIENCQNDDELFPHKTIPSEMNDTMIPPGVVPQGIFQMEGKFNPQCEAMNSSFPIKTECEDMQSKIPGGIPSEMQMDNNDTNQSAIHSNGQVCIPGGTILPGTLPPGILPPELDLTDNFVLYHCKFCDKSFFSLESRNIHQMIHIKPYQCRHCNESFLSAQDKMVHQKTHNKDQQYPCKYCNKPFSRQSDKTKHEKSHTEKLLYSCAYCSRGFATVEQKNAHEKDHTKGKPYKCTYCIKAFATSNSRKVHERIHTKEKPYPCRICSDAFGRTRDRNLHEMSHSELHR